MQTTNNCVESEFRISDLRIFVLLHRKNVNDLWHRVGEITDSYSSFTK